MLSTTQLCLLAAIATVGLADTDPTDNWTELRVTWGLSGVIGKALGLAYIALPLTQAQAVKEGWVQAASDDITSTWCKPNDPRVCPLYDQQGSIAGLTVGVPSSDAKFTGNPYPIDDHPLFNKMTLFNKVVYAGKYYIVDQDTLKAGGRKEFSKIGNGLWLVKGGELVSVPLTGDGLVKDSWTKENCIPQMGRHYYYNVTQDTQCEDFEPYFILTGNHNGNVQGVGFQTFGKSSKEETDWFETVPKMAVKPTVPTAPQCLVDWTGDYGVISLHMYFVKNPWYILC